MKTINVVPLYKVQTLPNLHCFELCNFRLTQLHKKLGKGGGKVGNNRIFKCVLNVCIQKWKHSDTKVAEEYCYVITQVARGGGQTCCSQSGYCVLGFGAQLVHLIYS